MAAIKQDVFSEYEVRSMYVTLGEDKCQVKCIGSLEESSEVITTTKKCRGVVVKKRTRGTGNGTLKVSLHIPWELYMRLMAMDSDTLADGVYGYGRNSIHPEFELTADVYDEDDVQKLKAWPRCTMNAGPANKVENGAEEVAEIEAEIAFAPDDNGFGHYEALSAGLAENIKTKWLTDFTPELVKKVAA